MGLLSECKTFFRTQDLYEVLGTSKSAAKNELRKAYYKASLKVHPDRADSENKDEATAKFQILGKAYDILSNEEKRSVYDDSGEVDDENFLEDRDWNDYWRQILKKISVSDIQSFEKQYKDSDEELDDLRQAYLDGEGSMDFILKNVMCATFEDEQRFQKIIKEWIKEKKVENFPKFSMETLKQKEARKRKAGREAKEAEDLRQELGLDGSEQSLRALIQNRNKGREESMDAFFDDLAAKYAAPKKTKSRSKK